MLHIPSANKALVPYLAAFLIVLAVFSCSREKSELAAGTWRGIITLQGQELPFNFDVLRDSGNVRVFLKNGDERLLLDEITTVGDSVNMALHIFDAELRVKIDGNVMSGFFIRNYARDFKFPFSATHGDTFRFEETSSPNTADFNGTYDVRFFSDKDTTQSVGIFSQSGTHVTGTFLLSDGDYRYLEGSVADGIMKLSAFDGNHAFLFSAAKNGDSLEGDFYSGKSLHQTWIAVRNENAKMPDPESLTFLKPGFEKIAFSFPDVDRKLISPADDRYKNKVVILQILGTWCPNCMDETRFLAPWYKANKDRGVEIIGLAYERKDDFDYASQRVRIMKQKMGVDYNIVIAGVNDKAKASETLPAINRIMGFPTTIIIGKDGKVKKIHTGFSGPGTGKYYEEFVQHFNTVVNDLLKEPVGGAVRAKL